MDDHTKNDEFHLLGTEYERALARCLSIRLDCTFNQGAQLDGKWTRHKFDLVPEKRIGDLRFIIVGEGR